MRVVVAKVAAEPAFSRAIRKKRRTVGENAILVQTVPGTRGRGCSLSSRKMVGRIDLSLRHLP